MPAVQHDFGYGRVLEIRSPAESAEGGWQILIHGTPDPVMGTEGLEYHLGPKTTGQGL